MSIKKNQAEVALTHVNLFKEQFRQKGLIADVDINSAKSNILAKDIQSIDDKALPGYDCDIATMNKTWGNVWVEGWLNWNGIGANKDDEPSKEEESTSFKP